MSEAKGPTPESIAKAGSELAHQMALFAWIALNKQYYRELGLLFAIKNEEKSNSAAVGARFKASGVRAGVADLFLPVARHNLHGLFLEMKKPGGKARPEQISFGESVKAQAYGYFVCDSWEKARDILIEYLA